MVAHVDLGPVIETSSLKVPVVYAETERMNEMEDQFSRAAKTGDVSGIGRNFRSVEDHLKEGIF
jgi:hypothetical protein